MEDKKIEWENNLVKEIIDFFKDLIIIVVVVKLVTMFLVSIFIINGQSMYGSYYDKQFILVDRFSLNTFAWIKEQNIKRWDVVVVEPGVDKDRRYFIKRIIWMPWEELKIEEWNVYLKKVWEEKFTILEELYLNKENFWNTKTDRNSVIYRIPDWKYFLMWDNRNNSSDSRSCFTYNCSISDKDNFIASDDIIWRVLLDLGYFNFRNFSFTHPVIKKDWEYISTKPQWMNSADSYSY